MIKEFQKRVQKIRANGTVFSVFGKAKKVKYQKDKRKEEVNGFETRT